MAELGLVVLGLAELAVALGVLELGPMSTTRRHILCMQTRCRRTSPPRHSFLCSQHHSNTVEALAPVWAAESAAALASVPVPASAGLGLGLVSVRRAAL